MILQRIAPERRVPWWLVLVVGVVCVGVGAMLALRPFRSLAVLFSLTAVGLLLLGVSHFLAARTSARPWLSFSIGAAWLLSGLAALAFPGLTIQTLTVVVGVVLLVSGVCRLLALRRADDERLLVLLGGIANLIFGALALATPAATVLVLAVLFGVFVMLFGLQQCRAAFTMHGATAEHSSQAEGFPRSWRLAGTLTALFAALAGATLAIGLRLVQPDAPGAFYRAPVPLPNSPLGTLLRAEVVQDFITGATTYRVLYISTGFDGQPTAVSGLVIVPDAPAPPQGRKVVAWTHGTVGVAANCAPSLIPPARYAAALPALADLVRAGYIVAATDYQGLGTAGPHPYLVGSSEGANALDSVRAVINLPGADAGRDFVVWGESQGGHAALFTGQMAATYAPELRLRGVVASAPAADLLELFKAKVGASDAIGNVLMAMAVTSWTRVYDDLTLEQVVHPAARPLITSIAENCIQNAQQIQRSIAPATLLNMLYFSRPPYEFEAWNRIIADNTPGGTRTSAPILLQQGSIDQVISPAVQARFAQKLCAEGDAVEYRLYEGIGHLTISHDTAPEVVQWIAERFAGTAPTPNCLEKGVIAP